MPSSSPTSAATWVYDYPENTWTLLSTTASPTSDHFSLGYQPSSRKILLFGNSLTGSEMETWLFDYATVSWTRFEGMVKPQYREHFAMAFNQVRDEHVLIGGFPNNDNWVLTIAL